ncbi:MAG: SWIM zinc finger domain-containing protein [Candidatus Azobacteroides sp.]|nr:SWIM zinc finger domain-containing protein [Candidatus Azobacteroides sp.]
MKIEEFAPNSEAARNGRDLVNKNRFSNLKMTNDKSVIWGECAGSGKNPYHCSIDLKDPLQPVFRCSCPSRQFPCKHALGLLFAFEKGDTFQTSDIPEDIVEKRKKLEKKQEKKVLAKEIVKEKAEGSKKMNTAAFVKKINVQLSGIEMAEKILKDLVQSGLASADAKVVQTLRAQTKELGNYHINGIQTAFNHLLIALSAVENEAFTEVIDQINYISTLLKKSTDYLNKRKDHPEDKPELDSAIEEQIGYVWKLSELMQYGLCEENAEITQLSFFTYDHRARKEWVDEGIWINLKNGKIYKTNNYRPYRAAKHIKEENSTFGILKLKEMFIYPGDQNPRIRWEPEALLEKRYDADDFKKIIFWSYVNYAEMIKSVKNTIKNPLMDKHPVVLAALHKAYLKNGKLVIEDREGNKLSLSDYVFFPTTTQLINLLPSQCENFALAIRMDNDVESGYLSGQPLSLITPEKIVRLLY